jgi:hypothetical protein
MLQRYVQVSLHNKPITVANPDRLQARQIARQGMSGHRHGKVSQTHGRTQRIKAAHRQTRTQASLRHKSLLFFSPPRVTEVFRRLLIESKSPSLLRLSRSQSSERESNTTARSTGKSLPRHLWSRETPIWLSSRKLPYFLWQLLYEWPQLPQTRPPGAIHPHLWAPLLQFGTLQPLLLLKAGHKAVLSRSVAAQALKTEPVPLLTGLPFGWPPLRWPWPLLSCCWF